MAFDLGDTVALAVDVLDSDGEPTTASTCTLTVTLPDGSTATPTVTSPDTGRYQADYVPAAPGRYLARWLSTGPATAFSDAFDVRPAAPAYILSLADAKAHLNLTSDGHDEELRFWLEVTTEIVDELAGKVTARRTVTEVREAGCLTGVLALAHTPVVSLTSVTRVDGVGTTTWDVDRLDVDPTSGIVRVLSGPWLSGPVRVVYEAGSQVIPARYGGAARAILRHLWESQRASAAGKRRPGVVDDQMQLVAGYAIPRAAADMVGPRPVLVA